MVVKAKNIIKHPSELKRTLKAFFTFYKHLFGKESKSNRSKFKSRLIRKNKHVGVKKSAKDVKELGLTTNSKKSKTHQKETVS